MTEDQKQALIEVQRYSVCEGWIVADEGGRLVAYEAFLALAQRAEAAEAKLAELASQPPIAYTDAEELDTMQNGTYADMFKPCDEYKSDPKWLPLFTRPAPAAYLAENVPYDYFGDLVDEARISADKAMVKFPQPNYVLLKVAEEAGEVVQAGVHYAEGRMKWDQLDGEVVQLLAMLIRLVTEGDQVNGVIPPQKHE